MEYTPTDAAASRRRSTIENFTSGEYRAVFDAAPDGIIIVDEEGRIRDVNPQAERFFGHEREELLGAEIERLVPERTRDLHRGQRQAYMAAPHARPMGIGLELKGRRNDGSEFPVEISLSPMPTADGQFIIAMVRDMTERNRLRTFGAGALQAAEDERQRIARELHDDTAQRLAALLMRLRVLRGVEEAKRREELLDDLRDELLETADAIRRIARGLRPPALEEMGIVTAIRSLARSVLETHGLEVEIDAPFPDPRLRPEAELALYRIVQEALSNVVRHAEASRARVSFVLDDAAVVALVEDDGCGFDPGNGREQGGGGLGLLGMGERARHVGGRVDIESAHGRGTRVRVEIPRPPSDADLATAVSSEAGAALGDIGKQ